MAKDREKPSTADEPEALQRVRAKARADAKSRRERQDEDTANQQQNPEVVESERVAQDNRFPVGEDQSAPGTEKTVEEWAEDILESYRAATANLIETGRRLRAAQAALTDEKVTELYRRLGFGKRTAQQLQDFHRSLGEVDVKKLPNTYRALNHLKQLEPTEVQEAIEQGDVHQGLKAKDAAALVQRYKGSAQQESASGTNLNYKLGQLRRLNTAFQDLKDDDIKSMVENLKESEREKLRGTIRSLEWYLEAAGSSEDEDVH